MRYLNNKQIMYSLLALSIIITPSVCSGFMPKIEIDRMWDEAEVAVHGRVVNITTNWNNGAIYRAIEIGVTDFYIQGLSQDTVRVRIDGGEVGDIGWWVEDQPKFDVGEEVFVFLREPDLVKEDYEYQVFAMSQGKFTVEGNVATNWSGESFTLPDPDDKIKSPRKTNFMGNPTMVTFEIEREKVPDRQTLVVFSVAFIVSIGTIIMGIVKRR